MTDLSLALSFRQQLRDCERCPLSQQTTPVPWHGELQPKYALIGEAPGQNEAEQGVPFVGKSGSYLKLWLKEAGIDPKKVTYLNSVQCVLPGTETTGPAMRAFVGFERRYIGEFLTLCTAFGHKLTVTPNHPILTDDGWIAANLLKPGMNLISRARSKKMLASDPHVQDVPLSAQERFRSLADAGVRERMTHADMDFHGDGMDGEVDVVVTLGKLVDRGKSTSYKQITEDFFSRPGNFGLKGGTSRTSRQNPLSMFDRMFTSSRSVMCSLDGCPSFLWGHPFPSEDHGFMPVPPVDTRGDDSLLEGLLSPSELITDTLGPFAREVSHDRLIEIRSHHDSSLVYNFSTPEGWYYSNGIVTHNCRPPNNRTPNDIELKACSPWVNGSLEFIRPEILITVGVVAFNQIRRVARPKLAVLHGKPMYHPRYGFTVFSSYHPAAAIRGSKKYERIIKEDLAAIANWDGRYPEDCYICGREFYRSDEWGISLCRLHCQNQGMLFPEDLSVG